MAGIEPLTHIVEDRDLPGGCFQGLPAATRRSAKGDITPGKSMTNRSHLARFSAQDVQHAYPIIARSDILERRRAEVIGQARGSLALHAARFCGSPIPRPIAALPPAIIQSFTLRA